MTISKSIRAIHWAIAIVVFINLIIFNDGEDIHRFIGYCAVLLVILRVIYSFTSSTPRKFPNKLALLTYIAIWVSLLALAATGYLLGTDKFWGDEKMEEIHEATAKFLEGLVIIHLIGITFDSYLNKRKTWLNMINGKSN